MRAALALLLCLPASAAALTAADEAEYARCTGHFKAKRYAAALQCYERFEARMRAVDAPPAAAKAMLRRAFTLEKLARAADAVVVYDAFLAAPATTAKDRAFAQRHRAKLAAADTGVIEARCPVGLKIRIDDRAAVPCPTQAIASAGPHQVDLLAGSRRLAVRRVVVTRGQKTSVDLDRVRRVRLTGSVADVRVDGASLGPTPISVWLPDGRNTLELTDDVGETRRQTVAISARTRRIALRAPVAAPSRILPWIVTGTGAALTAVGAWYLIGDLPTKQDAQADAQRRYDIALAPASARDARSALQRAADDAEQSALIGWIATGVGAAGLAAGLWWALETPDDPRAQWIAPTPGGAVWGGRW